MCITFALAWQHESPLGDALRSSGQTMDLELSPDSLSKLPGGLGRRCSGSEGHSGHGIGVTLENGLTVHG
jgi:hypothetical protein